METNVLNPVQDEQLGGNATANSEPTLVETTENAKVIPTPEIMETEMNEENEATEETAGPDLSEKTKPGLIELLRETIQEKPGTEIRSTVEAIKVAFYKRHKQEMEQLRKRFAENGGNPEEFVYEGDPYEAQLKELLSLYREKRNQETQELEKELQQNYQTKLQIIEEIKELVNKNEIATESFNAFRELQRRWKETGNVPKNQVNDLWNNYHLHVENFYNFIKINNELRDLDLKKNLEAKTELCEQAETLILAPNIVEAFRSLQELHTSWREIGPVALEQKEALWERFRNASSIINKKYQEYFDGIKAEQQANLNLKSELCAKVEAINEKEIAGRKEWEEETKQIIEIQKIWKTIGFAPKKENTKIFERFREACNAFFTRKQQFYADQKESFEQNAQAKAALCEKVEALQDSEEWAKTTNEIIEIQKEWKKIGPLPKKESDQLWNRFRGACDRFFERKNQHFAAVDGQYAENLKTKEAIIEELKAFDENHPEAALNRLKEIQRRWIAAGFVPIKEKKRIEKEYKQIIDDLFAKFKSSAKGIRMERYKDKVSSFKEGGRHGILQERDKIIGKIRTLENDITLWDNNIGFFADSKNAQSMIRDVQAKIEKAREEIQLLKEKLKIINSQNQ